MASKPRLTSKILSLFLSFTLLITQTGFAQVATVELNLSTHFAKLGSGFNQETFRLPHLRYISYNNLTNNVQILLDKGNLKNPQEQQLEESSRELLKYFLIGVTLPDDSFWVNLRPDANTEIIPDELAKTDIGKIFLESDVQLKRDTAVLTSPNTTLGKLYWDKLYQKAAQIYGTQNVSIPTLTRPWIVPGEIIIRESANGSAYIYKATLSVMLEQDHLKGSVTYNFTDSRARELNEYSSQLIRELILPELTRKVNNDRSYAALRQVYYSLILSRWFKTRFHGKGGLYASYINKSNLDGLASKDNWSKDTYLKQYQDSFKNGEYNIQENVGSPTGPSIRNYFSGGIELGGKMNILPQKRGSSPLIAGFTGSSPVFLAAATGNGLVPFSGVATAGNPIPVAPGISSSPVSFQDTSLKINLEKSTILGKITTNKKGRGAFMDDPTQFVIKHIPESFNDSNARIAIYEILGEKAEKQLRFEVRYEKSVLWVNGPNIYRSRANEWEYKIGNTVVKVLYDSTNKAIYFSASDLSVDQFKFSIQNFQIELEPISASSPISIQPVSSLRVYSDINQRIWLDGLTFEMLLSGEFENLVRAHGITGVTTNPSLIKAYLSDPRVIDKAKQLALKGMSREDIYRQLVSELATTVLEIFKKSGVENAKFSVELDPNVNNSDVSGALKEAMQWTNIDPEHMMVKVALTSDENGNDTQTGYRIIEEVISRGRNVNVTLIFTPEQYRKVVNSYIRGLQRGLDNVREGKLDKGRFNRIYSVASFFISRWDVYLEENKLMPEAAHGEAANAIATSAYNEIFKYYFSQQNTQWKNLGTQAASLGIKINPQDFLLASTGSKGADMLKKNIITEEVSLKYPSGVYVYPLQGPFVVNTLPYGTIKSMIASGVAMNTDGTVAKTIETNYTWSKSVLGEMSGANLPGIGAVLLKNATNSFLKDFGDVQDTLNNLVSGNHSSSPVKYNDAAVAFSGFEETRQEIFNSESVRLASDYELEGEKKQYPEPTGQLNSRFGYKDPNGALRMDNREGITEWTTDAKKNGAKTMLHIGIGGQGKSNSVQAEYWGEDGESKIMVLDRLGISIKQLFRDLLDSGYSIHEIVVHVSSKSGSTDEPLTIYQEVFSEFVRLMGIAEGMNADEAQALPIKFVKFLKEFNKGKTKSALFKGIPIEDFNRVFNLKERTVIAKVLERTVFTTSLNPDASRLYAFALGMKELNIANIAVFDFSEYTGGRFTENCESGSVTQSFQGLDIVQITEGLQKQAVNYWGTDGNNPDKNSALRAAILARRLSPSVMLVSVRSSNATSEAQQKEQLFPESNGKDGQGIWVVVSAGQEEMSRKIEQIEKQTGRKPLVVVVDQKGLEPMVVPQDVPTIRYLKEEISPLANAKFALWFQEFTVRYGLLSLADAAVKNGLSLTIPTVGASLMNKSVLEDNPNFWWLRDPQNQPMVELAKGVLVNVLTNLDKSDAAIKARYAEVENRVKNGDYIVDQEINLAIPGEEANLEAAAKQDLMREAGKKIEQAERMLSQAEDSASAASSVKKIIYGALEKIKLLKTKNDELAAELKLALTRTDKERIAVQQLIEENDRKIYKLYESINGLENAGLLDSRMEEAAKKIAILMLIAQGREKIFSPVFYTAEPNADILGEMLMSIDYGIGTRDQHANFQHRLDGKDATFNVLVDFVKPYSEVIASESKINTFGLANEYLNGVYPDEERREFLKAEFRSLSGDVPTDAISPRGKTYKKRFYRDVTILTLPSISSVDGLIAAFSIFNRAQRLFETAIGSSTTSSPVLANMDAFRNEKVQEEIDSGFSKYDNDLIKKGEISKAKLNMLVNYLKQGYEPNLKEVIWAIYLVRENDRSGILEEIARQIIDSSDSAYADTTVKMIITEIMEMAQLLKTSKLRADALSKARSISKAAAKRGILIDIASSSPVNEEDSMNRNDSAGKGGIDFRALPMAIQPLGNFKGLSFSLPALSSPVNIDKEISEISRMVDTGIVPSGERIRDLVSACYHKHQLSAYQEELLGCLMRICKLQEDTVTPTETSIKEVIVIVDSIR